MSNTSNKALKFFSRLKDFFHNSLLFTLGGSTSCSRPCASPCSRLEQAGYQHQKAGTLHAGAKNRLVLA